MAQWVSLKSSAMTGALYDEEALELSIRFTRTEVYTYYGVPKEVYEGLLAAKSKGTFFRNNIYGEYGFD